MTIFYTSYILVFNSVECSQNSNGPNWQSRRANIEKNNVISEDLIQDNPRGSRSPSAQREREQLYEAYNLLHTLAQVSSSL